MAAPANVKDAVADDVVMGAVMDDDEDEDPSLSADEDRGDHTAAEEGNGGIDSSNGERPRGPRWMWLWQSKSFIVQNSSWVVWVTRDKRGREPLPVSFSSKSGVTHRWAGHSKIF